MKLEDFVEREIDPIVAEWTEFARTVQPATSRLSDVELRDHGRSLLQSIIRDMRAHQSDSAQREKSRGNAPGNAPEVTQHAREHSEQRFSQGFSINQMVAEYRALRASVLRRVTASVFADAQESIDEVTRFGEAVDQAIVESIAWYTDKVDDSRKLLLGVLGHDLRGPLAVVRNCAYFLARDDAMTSAQSETVARVLVATDKMRRLIEELLDFTQTALGVGLALQCAPADMRTLCEDTIAEMESLHPDRKVVLETAGDLTGTWDTARIGQMLSNLTANAVQHGDPERASQITASGEGAAVVVRIHNAGAAIPEAIRRHLFEPLRQIPVYRSDRHIGSSGLGLGLYIAREVATAHHGAIDVTSSEEGGTTFSVRLPRDATAPP